MAHEFSVKEQGYEVQLQEMEDSCRKSKQELMRILTAQQKTNYKWKEETNHLTQSTEHRLRKLRFVTPILEYDDINQNDIDLILSQCMFLYITHITLDLIISPIPWCLDPSSVLVWFCPSHSTTC